MGNRRTRFISFHLVSLDLLFPPPPHAFLLSAYDHRASIYLSTNNDFRPSVVNICICNGRLSFMIYYGQIINSFLLFYFWNSYIFQVYPETFFFPSMLIFPKDAYIDLVLCKETLINSANCLKKKVDFYIFFP